MNKFWSRIFGVKQEVPNPPAWLLATGIEETFDIPMRDTHEAQLDVYKQLTWVQIAVNAVARTAANVPFEVFRLTGEMEEAIKNHPLEGTTKPPIKTPAARPSEPGTALSARTLARPCAMTLTVRRWPKSLGPRHCHASFPLTPTLSLGERERTLAAWEKAVAFLHAYAECRSPSPRGEGRGEGKGTTRSSRDPIPCPRAARINRFPLSRLPLFPFSSCHDHADKAVRAPTGFGLGTLTFGSCLGAGWRTGGWLGGGGLRR